MGAQIKISETAPAQGNSQAVLSAFGLTKRFGGFTAVDDFHLVVREHSIHALIGPNGAGKTTIFNLLTRFLTPTAGKLEFDGHDITRMDPAQVARLGLVRSFQISAVFPQLSVLDNVVAALQRPAGMAAQFWRATSSLRRLEPRAYELLDAVNLTAAADRPAASLSYGRKRALEIAMTLALDPKVMLLDEPMAGMGGEDIERMETLIRNAAVGRTILMVEHNLSVVANLCDRVTVLARGAILADGTYAEIASDPAVQEAYMGPEHD